MLGGRGQRLIEHQGLFRQDRARRSVGRRVGLEEEPAQDGAPAEPLREQEVVTVVDLESVAEDRQVICELDPAPVVLASLDDGPVTSVIPADLDDTRHAGSSIGWVTPCTYRLSFLFAPAIGRPYLTLA